MTRRDPDVLSYRCSTRSTEFRMRGLPTVVVGRELLVTTMRTTIRTARRTVSLGHGARREQTDDFRRELVSHEMTEQRAVDARCVMMRPRWLRSDLLRVLLAGRVCLSFLAAEGFAFRASFYFVPGWALRCKNLKKTPCVGHQFEYPANHGGLPRSSNPRVERTGTSRESRSGGPRRGRRCSRTR
jgi:hypothetical protein